MNYPIIYDHDMYIDYTIYGQGRMNDIEVNNLNDIKDTLDGECDFDILNELDENEYFLFLYLIDNETKYLLGYINYNIYPGFKYEDINIDLIFITSRCSFTKHKTNYDKFNAFYNRTKKSAGKMLWYYLLQSLNNGNYIILNHSLTNALPYHKNNRMEQVNEHLELILSIKNNNVDIFDYLEEKFYPNYKESNYDNNLFVLFYKENNLLYQINPEDKQLHFYLDFSRSFL